MLMNHQPTHSCDYCSKKLDRLMFCNHSHQVMYHRKGEKSEQSEEQSEEKPKEEKRDWWCEEHKNSKWVCEKLHKNL
ncbi:MAG: hypothetical protein DRJ15_16165 [Bacteroidetes bacterium]|nr:MAG: hypothetical protein DRJ15_16165 [Bacteroidota bacterium]